MIETDGSAVIDGRRASERAMMKVEELLDWVCPMVSSKTVDRGDT